MNFLAHAYLAGPDPADRVGGLLGDFVKGLLPAGLPPELAAGVALHRAIDSFADRHPAFNASRARVGLKRRRFSGVLVDMFYDHLLARDWRLFNDGSLEDYAATQYASMEAYASVLPAQAVEIVGLMRSQDWLCGYREVSGIGGTIDRMARYRLRRENPLAGGVEEFLADAAGFEADFAHFLPDAFAFAADWRERRVR